MRLSLSILMILIPAIASTGCSGHQIVQVVDPVGTPVPNAQVEAVSLSINSAPNITDAAGEAPFPSNIQGAKWVDISKAGFERLQVEVPTTWPLRVTLRPIPRP